MLKLVVDVATVNIVPNNIGEGSPDKIQTFFEESGMLKNRTVQPHINPGAG